MVSVHDMSIRAQSQFAAHAQAKGLLAANESGRGRLLSASTNAAESPSGSPDTASPSVRSE